MATRMMKTDVNHAFAETGRRGRLLEDLSLGLPAGNSCAFLGCSSPCAGGLSLTYTVTVATIFGDFFTMSSLAGRLWTFLVYSTRIAICSTHLSRHAQKITHSASIGTASSAHFFLPCSRSRHDLKPSEPCQFFCLAQQA